MKNAENSDKPRMQLKKMPLCSFALSNLWKENKFKEVIWMFVVVINKKKNKTKKLEKNILQD